LVDEQSDLDEDVVDEAEGNLLIVFVLDGGDGDPHEGVDPFLVGEAVVVVAGPPEFDQAVLTVVLFPGKDAMGWVVILWAVVFPGVARHVEQF
jgi:hypothetical protein